MKRREQGRRPREEDRSEGDAGEAERPRVHRRRRRHGLHLTRAEVFREAYANLGSSKSVTLTSAPPVSRHAYEARSDKCARRIPTTAVPLLQWSAPAR